MGYGKKDPQTIHIDNPNLDDINTQLNVMRQSELVSSLSPIETNGMTLGTFYIPKNPIILGTITLQ